MEIAWAAIPNTLRLDKPLSSYNQRHVEIDFLVSTKLNFAHVKFLLELTITPRVSNPGVELLRTSADMLSLVVEAIVLKQRLANSGTSLVWKVSTDAPFCTRDCVSSEEKSFSVAGTTWTITSTLSPCEKG